MFISKKEYNNLVSATQGLIYVTKKILDKVVRKQAGIELAEELIKFLESNEKELEGMKKK